MPLLPSDRVLVVVPTYNEAENLEAIIERLLRACPEVEALIVDDNSPDGTGGIAEDIAARTPAVHVLHRTAKAGLGAAYIAGFRWALQRDYTLICEMDADGSHPPETLTAMSAALADADIVLGSRWVPGGRVVNWPRRREALSRLGNGYARVLLGLQTMDVTGGFRIYRRKVLEQIPLDRVESAGYCFQIDMVYRAQRAGFRIVEVPIVFVERTLGESKMTGHVVSEALRRVTAWGVRDARHRWAP